MHTEATIKKGDTTNIYTLNSYLITISLKNIYSAVLNNLRQKTSKKPSTTFSETRTTTWKGRESMHF